MVFSVAIDGPAGAGKGTIAKYISQKFSFAHLDTGLLYREVGRLVIEESIDTLDVVRLETVAQTIDPGHLDEKVLRNEHIAAIASQVAIIPSVRRGLTQKMRDFTDNVTSDFQGVILDGRDVGTVILPGADVKIFVTADEKVRAHRRTKEMSISADVIELKNILEDIKTRDARDQNRQADPLQMAVEAILLDTTFYDIETVCRKAEEIVEHALLVYHGNDYMLKTSVC